MNQQQIMKFQIRQMERERKLLLKHKVKHHPVEQVGYYLRKLIFPEKR